MYCNVLNIGRMHKNQLNEHIYHSGVVIRAETSIDVICPSIGLQKFPVVVSIGLYQ